MVFLKISQMNISRTPTDDLTRSLCYRTHCGSSVERTYNVVAWSFYLVDVRKLSTLFKFDVFLPFFLFVFLIILPYLFVLLVAAHIRTEVSTSWISCFQLRAVPNMATPVVAQLRNIPYLHRFLSRLFYLEEHLEDALLQH